MNRHRPGAAIWRPLLARAVLELGRPVSARELAEREGEDVESVADALRSMRRRGTAWVARRCYEHGAGSPTSYYAPVLS